MTFEMLSSFALEALAKKGIKDVNLGLLRTIGRWYHRFMLSNHSDMNLSVPYYNKSDNLPLLQYLGHLDLLLKICSAPSATHYDGLAIISVTSGNSLIGNNRKRQLPYHAFRESKGSSLLFENGIGIADTRFVPLFPIDHLEKHRNVITAAFDLLKEIGKKNLIPYPVKIDLDQQASLLITQTISLSQDHTLFNQLQTNGLEFDIEKRNRTLNELEKRNIKHTLVYTYPFHGNIPSVFTSEFSSKAKQFKLSMRSRFSYNELGVNDIQLTPEEIEGTPPFSIFAVLERFIFSDDLCSPALYNLLTELKKDWQVAQLNQFTHPFPIKWFLSINTAEPLSYWQSLFKKDYSGVNVRLKDDALKLIEHFYELDWMSTISTESESVAVLPKLINFKEINFALKAYLQPKFDSVVFTDDNLTHFQGDKSFWIFDPFNIPFLSNLSSIRQPEKIKIIVPRVAYFSYQPYIKYLLARYRYQALFGGFREKLHIEDINDRALWDSQLKTLLRELRSEENKYQKVMGNETEIDMVSSIDGEVATDFYAEETAELVLERERRAKPTLGSQYLLVNTADGKSAKLKLDAPILVTENGFLIRTVAKILMPGMRFASIDEVTSLLKGGTVADRLSLVPVHAKRWQAELYEKSLAHPYLYQKLRMNGLSVSENRFNTAYLSQQTILEDFLLPRSKNDWEIVCKYLMIEEMQRAWINYKCRRNLSSLRQAYSRIILLLVENCCLGENLTDDVVEQVGDILTQVEELEMPAEERRIAALAIISDINRSIELKLISGIKEF